MKSRSLSPGTSLASAESLSMPLLQEVVLSADISCSDCQKRLSEMMSKMGEIESVVVNASEKRVTLVCRYPGAAKVPSTRLVAAVNKNPLKKISLIRRMLFQAKQVQHKCSSFLEQLNSTCILVFSR
ncbi:hypothetical protein C1H46_037855 [Malus baccata]|uniref:HMA domain-containing protein n=1 Tax=Malus baccata TaxID=106549 RepID=A0A540KR05_MALBA|nr:hypothetical protein C1H46_037855 [Malus baccata]